MAQHAFHWPMLCRAVLCAVLLLCGVRAETVTRDWGMASFASNTLTVYVRDTLEWRNTDRVAHSITIPAANKTFLLAPLGTVTWNNISLAPGTYLYLCMFTPFMRGALTGIMVNYLVCFAFFHHLLCFPQCFPQTSLIAPAQQTHRKVIRACA